MAERALDARARTLRNVDEDATVIVRDHAPCRTSAPSSTRHGAASFRSAKDPSSWSAPCRAFNPSCVPRYNRPRALKNETHSAANRESAKGSAMGSAMRAGLFFALPAALALGLAACGGGAPDTGSSAASETGGVSPPATGTAGRAAASPAGTLPERFGNVTRERLLAADSEPGNWFTEGRDFGESFYSPLRQIN